MRPIYGQVAYWPHGGRSPTTSRRRTSSGRFSNERLSGDDYAGSFANHIANSENAVVRPLPNFLAKSRVRRCRSLTRRPESSAARLTVAATTDRDLLPTVVAALLDRNDQRRTDRTQAWRQHRAQTHARETAYERITATRQQSRERERSHRADRGYGLEL
jgi:hypothetical protein